MDGGSDKQMGYDYDALGWMMSGRAVGDKSVLGVFVAVGGIITYSVVMLKHKAQGGK
ncbi:hypothetical protein M7I_6058 [Glarea lozoyensis 74030]|uniref:Uncharacterized protein n=1 Tax=Glarea lozoyensis (strain ATCC 74030 / MF5533) TaxID=1104152 RepID=H0ETJ4_GLAL7|nr:hypothetical protein M7I_6058 [Glarea lozoyensis 74030]